MRPVFMSVGQNKSASRPAGRLCRPHLFPPPPSHAAAESAKRRTPPIRRRAHARGPYTLKVEEAVGLAVPAVQRPPAPIHSLSSAAPIASRRVPRSAAHRPAQPALPAFTHTAQASTPTDRRTAKPQRRNERATQTAEHREGREGASPALTQRRHRPRVRSLHGRVGPPVDACLGTRR